MKKKYLGSLQMNISNGYCEKRKYLNNSLIHSSLFYILMFIKKVFKC